MNSVYEQKYLKYKKKYLELKKQQEAGYVGFQSVSAMVNAATSKMEKITAESYEKHFGTPEQKSLKNRLSKNWVFLLSTFLKSKNILILK